MSMTNAKVLVVSQYIHPFMDGTEMARTARHLPQGILEKGNEIRVFMPKFGSINERRHQLHEVIRLSGMNLIVNETDHQLLIKVASMPSARMQVYFIDNEEYFKRKAGLEDDDENFFEDNDERALFFCRGVLETVRKLGWTPDIIHCHGWMTALIPLYVKHHETLRKEPQFEEAKIVYSAYNEPSHPLNKDFGKKLDKEGFSESLIAELGKPSTHNLEKLAMSLSDGVVKGSAKLSNGIESTMKGLDKPMLAYHEDKDELLERLLEFFQEVMEKELV